MTYRLPMFPLGTTLVPHALLPLHVFEPRYLALTRDCLAGAREFGVVLIVHGSEVGGGDERTGIGAVAFIDRVHRLAEDRLALLATGRRRIHVVEWLPDDPYPAAVVEDRPDRPSSEPLEDLLGKAERAVRRTLALAIEMGESAAVAFALDPDPQSAAWQLVAQAPLDPFARHEVLGIDEPDARLRRLVALVGERHRALARRLHEK